MSDTVEVAEAKSRFSELLNRAAYKNERFLIRKHGKPVAAIVSTEDLARLESEPKPLGLAAAAGLLSDIPEWEVVMDEVVASRTRRPDREVDIP